MSQVFQGTDVTSVAVIVRSRKQARPNWLAHCIDAHAEPPQRAVYARLRDASTSAVCLNDRQLSAMASEMNLTFETVNRPFHQMQIAREKYAWIPAYTIFTVWMIIYISVLTTPAGWVIFILVPFHVLCHLPFLPTFTEGEEKEAYTNLIQGYNRMMTLKYPGVKFRVISILVNERTGRFYPAGRREPCCEKTARRIGSHWHRICCGHMFVAIGIEIFNHSAQHRQSLMPWNLSGAAVATKMAVAAPAPVAKSGKAIAVTVHGVGAGGIPTQSAPGKPSPRHAYPAPVATQVTTKPQGPSAQEIQMALQSEVDRY